MKNLKEFKPLIKLIKEEKFKFIIASIFIFISGVSEIATGYLNGAAVESITKLDLKNAIIYLVIYLILGLTLGGILLHFANSILYKIESSLTRKLGYFTYKKSLCLPAVAYEEKSSGKIINRITSDTESLSFAFGSLLNAVSSLSLVIFLTTCLL